MPTRDSYAHGTPSWIDLATPDLEASKSFYGELFGWTYSDEPAGDQGTYTMCSKDDHTVAGMMQSDPASGMPTAWNSYVTVDDIDATIATVEGNGGAVIAPKMEVMDAGHMAVVADPVGGVLSLWKADNHIGATLVNEHGSLIWNELMSTDIEKASSFWGEVFGWGVDAQDMGPMGTYYVFTVDGEAVAGGMAPPDEGMPSFWGVYLGADDCRATVEQARGLGATVLVEPNEIPDVGVIATIVDPQGAAVSVMTPAQQSG